MNMTFKAGMNKEWTLTDDRIIIGRKEIMLSSIFKIEHLLQFNCYSIIVRFGNGIFDQVGLHYPISQEEDGAKAAKYIIDHSSDEESKKKQAESEQFGVDDYYMQCDFCKHVFHYTLDDLLDDAHAEIAAAKQGVFGGVNMMVGNAYIGKSDVNRAEDKQAAIPDRNRCPKCGGSKLNRISEEEARAEIEKQNAPAQVVAQTSAADELKKFKELLDMGVISQEEFDAKKKQLLGL